MDIENKIGRFQKLLSSLSEQVIDKHLEEMEALASMVRPIGDLLPCPHCNSNEKVIRFGSARNKPRFKCNACSKTFVSTTKTIMYNSHQSADVWAKVYDDTMAGLSIDDTAEEVGLSHVTVFNMRHKILEGLQNEVASDNIQLSTVSELDETYVLESHKGTPIPDDYYRKPRKHGAVATKRGLSNEQICICTGVDRQEGVIADAVNRAKPTTEELKQVFEGHVSDETLFITDGLIGYKVLESLAQCTVTSVEKEEYDSFFHLNNVNNFHAFIKERYNDYRGVATKYLNRYNRLFSTAYKNAYQVADYCRRVLYNAGEHQYMRIKDIKTRNLLTV